jgi:hypothetical protein
VQISIGGTDVWRRLVIPPRVTLGELHHLIQALFGWKELYPYNFIIDFPEGKNNSGDKNTDIKETLSLAAVMSRGAFEFVYQYGQHWTVKIIILSIHNAREGERPHCTMGENAPPPETIEGPLRFRRFISALDLPNAIERENAKERLGENFRVNEFSIDRCNEQIKIIAGKL